MEQGQIRIYPVNEAKFIYHRDIGFPESAVMPIGFKKLRYSKHAEERQTEKYNGIKVLPTLLNITKENIVEFHTDDNITAKKLLVRITYDKYQDIVMAVQPEATKAKVITFWLNKKKDQHLNLDKTKYTKP